MKPYEDYFDLAQIMIAKRQMLDVYSILNRCEEILKEKMSGYEISRAEQLFRETYPDLSDD